MISHPPAGPCTADGAAGCSRSRTSWPARARSAAKAWPALPPPATASGRRVTGTPTGRVRLRRLRRCRAPKRSRIGAMKLPAPCVASDGTQVARRSPRPLRIPEEMREPFPHRAAGSCCLLNHRSLLLASHPNGPSRPRNRASAPRASPVSSPRMFLWSTDPNAVSHGKGVRTAKGLTGRRNAAEPSREGHASIRGFDRSLGRRLQPRVAPEVMPWTNPF